uniref:Uncharacterized protein n=1 Tax=Oncorhynchus mykiss TaxID=8022 RepID=A0A8K9WSZ1_ONCMY
MMESSGPVDGDVRLLLVQLHCPQLTELKQARAARIEVIHLRCLIEACRFVSMRKAVTYMTDASELYVVVTVVLGHLLSTGLVGSLGRSEKCVIIYFSITKTYGAVRKLVVHNYPI